MSASNAGRGSFFFLLLITSSSSTLSNGDSLASSSRCRDHCIVVGIKRVPCVSSRRVASRACPEIRKARLTFRFGEGYVAFLRFSQPVSAADLRRGILKYLPQAMISSRQATAARLLLPRSQDMALSVSFNMLKLLAEELKATDYTLTQSSLDQVSESNSAIRRFADSHQF